MKPEDSGRFLCGIRNGAGIKSTGIKRFRDNIEGKHRRGLCR